MGVATTPVYGADGRELAGAFLVRGIPVRVVGWWRALLAVLFGRTGGILLRRRGKHRDGGPISPTVVLDYETYTRMLVGLKRVELPDLGMAGTPAELAANENGAQHEAGGTF